MLGNNIGNKKMEYIKDYVVFDLETTGTSSKKDKIIEISAIRVRNGKIKGEFSTLVNPECEIPIQASRVNGIYNHMLNNSPTIEEALKEFIDFIGDDILVGHNIHSFDMKFIYRECNDIFGKAINNDYVDTLPLAKLCIEKLDNYRLTTLAQLFSISVDGAHRALNDCRMNQAVFEKLGQILNKNNFLIKKCPACGAVLKKRNGKYGEFFGCSNFPKCRYTENI